MLLPKGPQAYDFTISENWTDYLKLQDFRFDFTVYFLKVALVRLVFCEHEQT